MKPPALSRDRVARSAFGAWLLALVGLVACEVALISTPYPSERLDQRPASWRMLDRDGDLLRETVGPEGVRAQWVGLDDVSDHVVRGTVAVEDKRFWTHHGVDQYALTRAMGQNLWAGHVVSGASTLTMQLARLLGNHPRSLQGKVAQAADAVRLERAVDKRTLLEHYLNRAPYGAGTIGIEAASQRYFGKPSLQLSLAEAALLSGLPQAPSGHNPFREPESAIARQRAVLAAMLATGAIDRLAYDRAVAEPLVFKPATNARPTAMHFTEHVLAQGLAPGTVATTLDLSIHNPIERMVRDHVATLRDGGLTQAAVVVLDNKNCDVLSMVGSTDWWEASVNGATALRQPGSALKPFTYALAFEGRYNPASIVADIPTKYLDGQGRLIHPRNYSESYVGPVLAREALGRSLNVPAVRLANAVGLEEVLQTLRAAGFSSFDQDAGHYGLGLSLGNGEVTLLDLAQGYATFAREGRTCRVRTTADDPVTAGEQLFSEQVAFLVTDILSDEALRIRAFGTGNPLLLGYPVAIKTGTSSNWRDSWAVGYTDEITVAVWTGDFDGRPMDRLSGAVGAGPLLHQVLDHIVHRGAIAKLPQRAAPPDGIEAVEVCPLSGLQPTEHCPHVRTVHVSTTVGERESCSWHRTIRIDKRNGGRASDRCPDKHVEHRVYEALPAAYAKWQSDHSTDRPPTIWSAFCPHDGLTTDAVVVTHPVPDDVYLIEPGYDRSTQTLQLSVEVDPPVPDVTWLLDGKAVATVGWPYDGSWPLEVGRHEVTVIAAGRKSEPIHFEVR